MTWHKSLLTSLIARFVGPTWGPFGADRTQVSPMLAPWTLLSGMLTAIRMVNYSNIFMNYIGGYIFIGVSLETGGYAITLTDDWFQRWIDAIKKTVYSQVSSPPRWYIATFLAFHKVECILTCNTLGHIDLKLTYIKYRTKWRYSTGCVRLNI